MKKFLKISLIGLIVGAVLGLLFILGFFASARLNLVDKLFLKTAPHPDIIIVEIDNKSIAELGRWPWNRDVFARLIDSIGQDAPAVIGLDVIFPEASEPARDQALWVALEKSGVVVMPIEASLRIKNEIVASELLFPTPVLAAKALGLAITNMPPDKDGKVRSVPVKIKSDTRNYLKSFAAAVAEEYLKSKNYSQPDIKTDKQGRMLVNFSGPPGNFVSISASDVVAGRDKISFQGKIVLIGATAPDLHDEQLTPVSGSPMSGVEIHANAVDTIIRQRFLKPIGPFYQAFLFIVLGIATAAILFFFKMGLALALSALELVVYFIASFLLFDRGAVLDLLFAAAAILFSYFFGVAYKYLDERREKRKIKNALSRYVAPDVVKEILSHPGKLRLGGEKKELTVLFSDIRGFTAISEKLSPEKLVSLLNKYLTEMSDLIMKKSGVVDKYIGDAIIAFWGAPLELPAHPSVACAAALGMMEILKKEKPNWEKEFGVELNIGIGLNTGEAIIGNMGSESRFDYTVMGDSVNLASRLESLTKQYGVNIIISEFTKNKAGAGFVFRFLDIVAVKGKTEGVRIYELFSQAEKITDKDKEFLEEWEAARKLYDLKNWPAAAKALNEFVLKYPLDMPAKILLSRAQEFEINPPAPDWNGVYVAKEK